MIQHKAERGSTVFSFFPQFFQFVFCRDLLCCIEWGRCWSEETQTIAGSWLGLWLGWALIKKHCYLISAFLGREVWSKSNEQLLWQHSAWSCCPAQTWKERWDLSLQKKFRTSTNPLSFSVSSQRSFLVLFIFDFCHKTGTKSLNDFVVLHKSVGMETIWETLFSECPCLSTSVLYKVPKSHTSASTDILPKVYFCINSSHR